MTNYAMTYDDLADDLQKYTARSNDQAFIDRIPEFITFAQYHCSRVLNVLGSQKSVTDNLQAGVNVLQKPTYLLRTISFFIEDTDNHNKIVQLFPRSLEYCNRYQIREDYMALPEFYGDFESYDTYIISPKPDKAYPYKIIYHALLDPLTEETQQNWLTKRAPDLLLTAALIKAYKFVRNYDLMTQNMQEFDKLVQEYTNQDLLGMTDRSINRKVD